MSASKKAKQIAKYFRQERADYEYTKDVFRKLGLEGINEEPNSPY